MSGREVVSESYRLRLQEAVSDLYLPGDPRVSVSREGVVTLTTWDHEGVAGEEELSMGDVAELIQALSALLRVMVEHRPEPLP